MKKLMEFFELKMAPKLLAFANLKYIAILQNVFNATMPALLIGSMFLLIGSFPIEAVRKVLGPLKLSQVSAVSTDLYSVLLVVAAAYCTAEYYNKKENLKVSPVIVIVLSLSAFVLCVKPLWGSVVDGKGAEILGQGSILSMQYLGTKGILGAIVIGIISTEFFIFFIKHKIVIKMPEGVPPMVAQSFAAIIPYFIIMFFWWALAFPLNLNIPQLFLDLFQPLVKLGDTVWAVAGMTLLNRILWAVGIHGSNVVSSVSGPLLSTMSASNLAAASAGQPLPYIASTFFYDNFIWVGFAPLALVLIMSKSPRLKSLGLLALPAALFNIGEPIIFGLPIVLNPLMFIPFVIGYTILSLVSFFVIKLGFIPNAYMSVMWTMPAPIKAYLATNYKISAAIYVLILWIILFAIFYPFVKMMEKEELLSEKLGDEK